MSAALCDCAVLLFDRHELWEVAEREIERHAHRAQLHPHSLEKVRSNVFADWVASELRTMPLFGELRVETMRRLAPLWELEVHTEGTPRDRSSNPAEPLQPSQPYSPEPSSPRPALIDPRLLACAPFSWRCYLRRGRAGRQAVRGARRQGEDRRE